MKRLAIRGGMGLGDALYVQGVARHLVKQGHALEICTAWPDVFRPLGDRVSFAKFRRDRIDRVAHYTARRSIAGTSQFEDVCIQAGIREPVEFRLEWRRNGSHLVKGLKSAPRPIVLVQMPRAPFGRSDGFGLELLPRFERIQEAIDALAGRAYLIQIGKGEPLFKFKGLDLDLANKTTVCELLDLAESADGFLGFCSFLIPLAESFAKPALLIWSRRGLSSPHLVIRQMTPQKILHRASSQAALDDCAPAALSGAVNAFCEQIRDPLAA